MLAVVILTYNEELNLPACLSSVDGLANTVLVVDSGSTDQTVAIATAYGARILIHPFESHAAQWTWALGQLEPQFEWVLGLDADQRLSPELRSELARIFSVPDVRLHTCNGFYVKRRQIFRGQWIRCGGYYPKYLLKLFRVRNVRIDARDLVDHHFYVSGKLSKLCGDLIEDNRKEADLGFWMSKHIRYAELHAREELSRRNAARAWLIPPKLFGTPDQRVVLLKRIWYHIPLYVRPCLYFVYRYILRGGFRDGKQGFIFHFMQSFWYRLLVDIRLDELLHQSDSAGSNHPEVTIVSKAGTVATRFRASVPPVDSTALQISRSRS
jgi:glycosyltransferase involved in cell wall biosynthesis